MTRFFYTVIIIFIALSSYSQNISISSFVLDEMDITANQQGTIVLDQNGEKCALIKVMTPIKGFSFDVGSLGVQKVEENHIGETWIYVPHGIRRLTIRHEKYGVLRNYNIPIDIAKARTYVVELKAEIQLAKDEQKLNIKCTPKNAVITIDGEMIEIENGMGELMLKLGSHNYKAMANGYFPQDGTIELKKDYPAKLTIELDANQKSTATPKPHDSNNKDLTVDVNREQVQQVPSSFTNNNSTKALQQFVKEVLSWYGIEGFKIEPNNIAKKYDGKVYSKSKSVLIDSHAEIRLKNGTCIIFDKDNCLRFIVLENNKIYKEKTFPSMLGELSWESSMSQWRDWLVKNDIDDTIEQNNIVTSKVVLVEDKCCRVYMNDTQILIGFLEKKTI